MRSPSRKYTEHINNTKDTIENDVVVTTAASKSKERKERDAMYMMVVMIGRRVRKRRMLIEKQTSIAMR